MKKQLSESDMYYWRVKALMNWIETNKNPDGSLSMEKLSKAGHLDQYHYLGLKTNDEVIEILGLHGGMSILDVGCGIGGPARYIAWKSGCQVTGIDIQPDLVAAGNAVSCMVYSLGEKVNLVSEYVTKTILPEECLGAKVNLVSGDVTKTIFPEESFDAFVSLLVILHIDDRASLFSSLFTSLKSGGGFLIEDMVTLHSFDPEQTRIAREVIGAPNLPSMEEYRNHLTQAGFVDVHFQSLTPAWVQWCVNRSHQYEASKEEQIRMHGEKVFNQRSSFYSDVKNLFLSGKLGGFRITGRKPSYIETRLSKHRGNIQSTETTSSCYTVRIIE